MSGVFGTAYAAARVDLPGDVPHNQSTIIYYSDGRTEMARVGTENRTQVKLSQVPEHVRLAVLAAENRGYYDDNGISPGGIARALWANVRGKDVQGGSTITQQYVKNAYLTQDRTYQRKAKELLLSLKLDHSYSKDQILEWYLNAIYFGRGAYGIEAAAETYFGVAADKLTLEQGAVLASSIRSPDGYDPQDYPQRAHDRWTYVLAGMVDQHWLSAIRAKSLRYPTVRPIRTSPFNDVSGPKGYIVSQVENELQAHGISSEMLRRGGLKIVTTIDKQAQDSAVTAIKTQFAGQPKDLKQALVAIEPNTGRVKAYFGGNVGYGAWDHATHAHLPGPTIGPYVLAEALSQGTELFAPIDGTSPRRFRDRKRPVTSSGDGQGEPCGSNCDLFRATVLSNNTTHYTLTAQVGAKRAAQLAARAGIGSLNGQPIQSAINSGKLTNGFGLGEFAITPIDQAVGYATFAANGVRHDPYFVDRVVRMDSGETPYAHQPSKGRPAFAPNVAGEATMAMQQVLDYRMAGPYNRSLANWRPAAGKLGTAQDPNGKGGNAAAWMCGYTPQLATAVWVGPDRKALVDRSGRQVFAIGLPALTWQAFMDGAHRGKPVLMLHGSSDKYTLAIPNRVSRPTAVLVD